MLVFLFAFILALALAWLSSAWVAAQLRAERSCSATEIEAGQSVRIQVRLEQSRPRAVAWMLAEDLLPEKLDPQQLRVSPRPIWLANFDGKIKTLEWSYELSFLRRGLYAIGPLLIETGDGFGFFRRVRALVPAQQILVLPNVAAAVETDFWAKRPGLQRRPAMRLFEDPARICGVRPFQPGDSLRRVHWRASARSGAWQSKAFEPATLTGATFLLDFNRSAYAGANGPALAEFAIRAVCALAARLWEQGQPIGFASNGWDSSWRLARSEALPPGFATRRRALRWARGPQPLAPPHSAEPVLLEPKARGSQLEDLLRLLSRLEWSDGSPFAEMIDAIGPRLSRNTPLAAVLAEVDEETAQALGALRRSGWSVAVVVLRWEQGAFYDWAQAPEWAERLMAESIPFHLIDSEEALEQFAASGR